MKKTLILLTVSLLAFATAASAANFPSYYPTNGFQRNGLVDAFYDDESRVVINDIQYRVSSSVVVHSLSRYRDLLSRIRPGANVAFRMGGAGEIVEFWLLPADYDTRNRR